ncbi:MAG: hypothetical protein ACRBHB_10490 [Arenicella sp.]
MRKLFVGRYMTSSFFCVAMSFATVQSTQAQTTVPDNAKPTCVVSQSEIDSWFVGGSVTDNGQVNPADSTAPIFGNFADNTRCDFYKWGAQMFLWLTTPESGSFVFDSSVFFDVIHDGSSYKMIPNTGGYDGNAFALRALKGADPIDGTGQAGGSGVLISQENSLTYYGMNVNDVYAHYLTGQKAGAFANTPIANDYPTTQADLELVQDYAGQEFPDGQALAMEIKTSWVDASTVPNKDDYVLIEALVPNFDRGDTVWTLLAKPEPMQLAMVGMHVVGSVTGHPELIWSTFEHIDNAPDNAYYYTNTSDQNTKVDFNSSGNWLFMKDGGANTNVIPEYQSVCSSTDVTDKLCPSVGDIFLNAGSGASKIQAVDVVRINPWGGLPDSTDSAVVANATDLVSINSSVMQALNSVEDLRGNYIQTGGIWSAEGQIPVSGTDSVLRGSLSLSNATMETYHQFSTAPGGSSTNNCFTCHSVGSGSPGVDVSHIFNGLEPLNN